MTIVLTQAATSPAPVVSLAGRFFVGVGSGVATVVTPMYLSDIAPVSIRGTISVLNQLGITVGIFFSQCLGLQGGLATMHGWRYLLGLPLVRMPGIFLSWQDERGGGID